MSASGPDRIDVLRALRLFLGGSESRSERWCCRSRPLRRRAGSSAPARPRGASSESGKTTVSLSGRIGRTSATASSLGAARFLRPRSCFLRRLDGHAGPAAGRLARERQVDRRAGRSRRSRSPPRSRPPRSAARGRSKNAVVDLDVLVGAVLVGGASGARAR